MERNNNVSALTLKVEDKVSSGFLLFFVSKLRRIDQIIQDHVFYCFHAVKCAWVVDCGSSLSEFCRVAYRHIHLCAECAIAYLLAPVKCISFTSTVVLTFNIWITLG